MERLEGELTRKKVNIFTDICHRMKERPFSLQSGKGRDHQGLGSSFTPRSALPQPEQSEFMSSKLTSAALHRNITLKPDAPTTSSGNDVAYHPNSTASPLRKSTREPSTAKEDSTNVPEFKQKDVLLRTLTTPISTNPPLAGVSNLLAQQQQPRRLIGPKPFPLSLHASQLGVTHSKSLENFPFPSQDHGKVRAPTPHQDEDNELAVKYHNNARINVALRTLPVDSREIKTAHLGVHSSSHSTGFKRVLGHSDGECGRKVKRPKEDNPNRDLAKPTLGDEDHSEEDHSDEDHSDEDSLDRVVDPSTLCPYCDEPLPRNPTPQLNDLLATAKQQSYRDPRPHNPLGLKAPLGIYISACQRHHFETHSLPEALEKGWPQSIDFKEVPTRVESMKSALEDIITDADNSSDDDGSVYGDTRGPRARSIFWRELKKEIKKRGSRTTTSVKGQFSTFEKTQPGYYGELGMLIIHQTLYNLFPLSSFDTSLIAPFSPAEFVQLVLVPEVAVRLIMQDLHLNRDEAVMTLRESSQYGVGMFPDADSGSVVNDDYESVADRIVMERAKARRLELEEEEKIEEKTWTK